MAVQRLGNAYILIAYFWGGLLALYCILSLLKTIRKTPKQMFFIMLFFWYQEFSSAQENRALRYVSYALEIVLMIYLFFYALKHRKRINRKQFKITTIVFILLLGIDFIGTISAYRNPVIFFLSAYDSCKYFILIYYILSLQPSEYDIGKLLQLLSGVVIVNTFCALLQFSGIAMFFDFFRGKYNIVKRFGSYRAIGIFPHGIELGNYSSVLFAIYYNYSKLVGRNRKPFFYFTEICLICCVITSGTRIAMANVIIILIVSNLQNIKSFIQTVLIILMFLLVGISCMNLSRIVIRTKMDIDTELPRNYYMAKGIDVWRDYPLFGIGYATYGSDKYRTRTNDIVFNKYNAHAFDYAKLSTTDSFFAEVLPEFGVIGIVTWLFYGFFIFFHYKKKNKERSFYFTFLCCILSIFIMAINTSTAFISPHIGTWFWISCGMLLCGKNTENELVLRNQMERV